MSLFEKCITEGNEKADELAKEGAMVDGGVMAQARASTIHQEREDVYAVLQYAASFHCLVEEKKECKELKPKSNDKLIFMNKYRCMRCGRSSKNMKMQEKCEGPKWLMKDSTPGSHQMRRYVDTRRCLPLLALRPGSAADTRSGGFFRLRHPAGLYTWYVCS